MATYASNSEIKFDTGRPITALLDEDLTATEQANVIRVARQRAFEKINSQLTGRTAIPAFHIQSLKQVEIDYVIADLISGAYTLETVNQSDWGEKYQSRAEETLQGLRFEASAEEPVAFRGNTGNGRLSVTAVYSEFCKTEMWTLRALSATEFKVVGSVSGGFPNLTVGEVYPEKDWSSGVISDYGLSISNYPTVGNTPFMLKVTAGSTAFEDGDVFTFRTYGSEARAKGISTGKLVRA
jgi:hypothetical protein